MDYKTFSKTYNSFLTMLEEANLDKDKKLKKEALDLINDLTQKHALESCISCENYSEKSCTIQNNIESCLFLIKNN